MGFALFYTSVLSLSVGAEKIRIVWEIHSKPIAKMYAAVIMMLAVLTLHHRRNVGGRGISYLSQCNRIRIMFTRFFSGVLLVIFHPRN